MGKIISHVKNAFTEQEGEHLRKKSEPWTVVYCGRVFGIPVAKAFARLHIHPNTVTIVSIPFTVLAGVCFFYNYLVFGALFYFISYILDCADGSLARLTNTTSEFGEKLDYYTDIVGNIFMYFGLWYSQYYSHGRWFIGGSIIAVHYFTIAFGYIFLTRIYYKTISPKVNSYYTHCDEGFLTFLFAPLTGMYFIFVFPILVLLQVVSYVVLFLTQKEKPDIRKNIRSMLKI